MGFAQSRLEKAGSRTALRYPTDLRATVVWDRQEYSVSVKDISSLGCCVSGPFAPEKGDEIIVMLAGLNVVATVAWTKGCHAGANFHCEINPLKVVRDNSQHPMFSRRRLSNTMMMTA